MPDRFDRLIRKIKRMTFGGDNLNPLVLSVGIDEWTPQEDGSEAIRIDISEGVDATCILLRGKAGSVHPRHYHTSTESIICLGECIIETPEQLIHLDYNDSHTINTEISHEIKFIKDTILIISWHPMLVYKDITNKL